MDNTRPQWEPNFAQSVMDHPGSWSASVADSSLFQKLPTETLRRIMHFAAEKHPRKGLAGFAAASSDCHTLARPFLFMNMHLPSYREVRLPGRQRRIEESLIERLSVCAKGINDQSIAPYVRNLWITNPRVPRDTCYRLLPNFTGLRSLHLDSSRAMNRSVLTFKYLLRLSELDIRYLWIESFQYRPDVTWEEQPDHLLRQHFAARSWRLEQLTLRSVYDKFDIPSQGIFGDLVRLCGSHLRVLSCDVHPGLNPISSFSELQSFQLERNDLYDRFRRLQGFTEPHLDRSPWTPIHEGSFIRQIQSLSVNTAAYSAQQLLSQKLPNVSIFQVRVSRYADLLLRFLSLNPQISVLSIQHIQPQAARVDEWDKFLDKLASALHRLSNLEALQIDIDDEDLTPDFIGSLSTLPHLKKLSLGEKQQKAMSEAFERWPASSSDSDLHFPALEYLVLDIKKYAYLDKQSANARPNFEKLTKRNLGKSRYHDWMRQQAEGWGKRCLKLKWMLMYRLYFGGLAFSFDGEGEGRRGRPVGAAGRRPYDELESTFQWAERS